MAIFGLRPAQKIGGAPWNGSGVRHFAMTTNSATAIYTGDLVSVNSGAPTAVAASPTTTRDTATPVGVCVGVEYCLPTTGQPQWAPYLPANAVTNGYTNIKIHVCEDPDVLFFVHADEAITAAAIGKNAPLINFGGNTATGLSTVELDTSAVAITATLAVHVVDVDVDNQFALVKFNQGVHAYQNATGA